MKLTSASFKLQVSSVKVLGLEDQGTLYADISVSCPQFFCLGTARLQGSIATVKETGDGTVSVAYYFETYWSGISPFYLPSCDRCGIVFRIVNKKFVPALTEFAEEYLVAQGKRVVKRVA